jgi:hypothetical protein
MMRMPLSESVARKEIIGLATLYLFPVALARL